MANDCELLTRRAGGMKSLKRTVQTDPLWDFVGSWIRRFHETQETNVAERMIYLWVSVNAWASTSVPELEHNHEDIYLVHCMARDEGFNIRFARLYEGSRPFREKVDKFVAMGPVFQVLWLRNNGVDAWNLDEDRASYVRTVLAKGPYIARRGSSKDVVPAFAPACAGGHMAPGEQIPADWPHVLSMIYQVRCNLFHGGKDYARESDRAFIGLAYAILWEMWRRELPDTLKLAYSDPQNGIQPPARRLRWNLALRRSGFLITEDGDRISVAGETDRNKHFLSTLLQAGGFGRIGGERVITNEATVDQGHWLQIVDDCHSGAECGQPDDLEQMDAYIAGIVRWSNVIGLCTANSCDGHGTGEAYIVAPSEQEARLIAWLLNGGALRWRQQDDRIVPALPSGTGVGQERFQRLPLLGVAGWLHDKQSDLAGVVALMRQSLSLGMV